MAEDQKTFRVIIWAVPRSISTCVLKCLSFQPNTQAWFEPYCLSFFSQSGVKRMGVELPRKVKDFDGEAFAAAMSAKLKGTPREGSFSPEQVDISLLIRDGIKQQLDSLPANKSHVIKDMAYGATGYYDALPSKESNFRHVFLIRHPASMFPSWRRLLLIQLKNMGHLRRADGTEITDEEFDMTTDVPFMLPGYMYKCQYDLWKHVQESGLDANPVVIDCDELARNPADLLPKLCEAAGMPYDKSLLEWDGNPDVSDNWRSLYPFYNKGPSKQQHLMALTSTSFNEPKPPVPRDQMKPDTVKCVDATIELYEKMAACRIKPDA